MKQYIRHFLCLTIAMVMAMPNLVAQVDLQKSFYVMHNDSTGVTGKLEGGEWLIRFSDTDSLGNQFSNPVAMNIEAAYYGDTTYIEMQTVDSVLFEVPEDEMKPGVFELTEDHFKYIIGSDSATTIRFRIDCLTKIDLPKVGQKVLCNIFRDYLPCGFVGQVESMKASYDLGYIEIKAEPIPLSAVYSTYYRTGFSGSDSLEAEARSRSGFVTQQRRLDPANRELDPGMHFDGFEQPIKCSNTVYVIAKQSEGSMKSKFSRFTLGTAAPTLKEGEYNFFKLGVKANGSIEAGYCVVINEQNGLDEFDVDFSFKIDKCTITPVLSLGPTLNSKLNANKNNLALVFVKDDTGFQEKYGGIDEDIELVPVVIPTPIPGLSLNFDVGVELSAALAASLQVDFVIENIETGLKLSMADDDLLPDLDFVSKDPKKSVGFSPNIFVLLEGKASIGLFGELGIGLLGKGLELQAKVSPSVELDARFGMRLGEDDTMGYTYGDIERGKEMCDSIVGSDKIDINAGLKIDGILSLAKLGSYSVKSLLGFSSDPFMFNLFRAASVPSIEFKSVKNSYDQVELELGNTNHLFFDTDISAFLKPSYAGQDLEPVMNVKIGTFSLGSRTLKKEFAIDPSLRGSMLDVYPYYRNKLLGNPLGKNYIPGVYKSVYIPHKMSIKEVQSDYGNLLVQGAIDDDLSDDVGMLHYEDKEIGVVFYDKNKNEISRLLEPAKETGNVIERTFDSNDCEGITEGFVSAAVYDDYHKRTSESRLVPFKILEIYDPKTLDYENVTTSGATVWAELHEVLVDQIKKGQVTDLEVGFHIQKYTGESSDVWTNAITIPFTDTRYCYQFVDLEPGQGYQYYAAVRKNKDVIYRGETKSFTTLSVIQGLDVTNIGPSRAYLLAEIAKSEDFKTTSVMFQFSEDETFKTTIDVTTEGSDWDFDSETDYYPVSKECDGLAPETEYYYRLAWVRNGEERLRYSEAKTFTTEPPLKNLTHSALGSTRMVIAADIAKIFEDRHFELQLSTNKEDWPYYKYTVEKEESDSPDYNSFTFDIKDLKSQKKYYYRFRCWLGSKEYYSDIMSFTMPKPDLSPTVADVKVTGNSVKITASIPQDLHDREPEHLYFVVATKKDYSMSDNSTLMVTVPFEKGKLKYEAEFSGLQYDKTYYCTFVAGTIVEEWGRADMKSFKTDKNPADTQSCITLDPVVQSDTVTFVGKINDATTLSLFRSAEYPHSAVGFELFKGEGLTNAESDYIVFEVDKTTGEFRSEGNRLQPETTYTYRAFVNLTGDKRVYSENSITFKTARYDGDLVIPDAKKRQGDLEK